jgi:regulator of protease activity HflC (stomatin/prohibitin superfamily)
VNQLLEWISRLFGSWKFWVVIAPWDIGIRVRLGKKAARLDPGPHWRIPFFDEVTLVNTRLRISGTPPITIQGENGKCRTITLSVGFFIRDPLLAVMQFDYPATAVQGYAQAQAARLVPEEECMDELQAVFETAGVEIAFVRYVEDVEAQTIRLLQNSWSVHAGGDQYAGPSVSGATGARY